MATAAPAAVASPAPPPPAADVAAAAPAIRPIPPKGATPKGQDLGLHLKGVDPELGVTKIRDDRGRFTATDTPSGVPRVAADAAPAPDTDVDGGVTPPEPAIEGFKFGGQDFRDQAHAEQTVSTLIGQFRAMGEREQNASKLAHAWMNRAQALETAVQSLGIDPTSGLPATRGAGAAAPAAATSSPTAEQPFTSADAERIISEAVDMKIYQQILQRDGPGLAQVYLHQANKEAMKSVLGKLFTSQEQALEQKLAPFQEWVGNIQMATTTQSLFNEATAAADESGQPFFPELRDMAAREGIADVWLGLLDKGVPQEFLMGPEGVHMAVSLYRDVAGYQTRRGNGNGTAPANSSPDSALTAQVTRAATARAAGEVVAPGVRSQVSPTGAQASPQQAAARAIMAAGVFDTDTGVRRR